MLKKDCHIFIHHKTQQKFVSVCTAAIDTKTGDTRSISIPTVLFRQPHPNEDQVKADTCSCAC